MLNKETGDWLWSKPKNPNQPNDIGYLIGFKMAQSFFDKSENKQKAVEDLVSIRDYENFFHDCDYVPE